MPENEHEKILAEILIMAGAVHQLSVIEPHLRNFGQHAQSGAPVVERLNPVWQLDSIGELLDVILVGENLGGQERRRIIHGSRSHRRRLREA